MTVEGPGGAGARQRARRRRFSLPRFLLLFAALWFGLLLVAVLVPQTPVEVGSVIRDTSDLRVMCGALIEAGSPLAGDGRLDVYWALDWQQTPRKQIVDLCFGDGAGKGPTWEEIQAGDYTNFPYQRHLGAFDRDAQPPVPVLWEREPRKFPDGKELGRLVAYSDGSVHFLDGEKEAMMQEFFRNNPGQE